MFRNVKYGYGLMLSPTWNFRGLVNSMILLFKVATGDSWFNLMFDAAVSPPFCTRESLPVAEEWICDSIVSDVFQFGFAFLI